MSQYAAFLDADGNFTMVAGMVVCLGSTTTYFEVGSDGVSLTQPSTGGQAVQRAIPAGDSFRGGSGRNFQVTGGPVNPDLPKGYFKPVVPGDWRGQSAATVTRSPADGTVSLHDGTDVVASGPAIGVLVATVSAGTFPAQAYTFAYATGAVRRYVGALDPSKYILWDTAYGDADLFDENGEVGSRSTSSTGHPNGTYNAGPTGEADYNGGNPWSATISTAPISVTMASSAYADGVYNGGLPFTLDISAEMKDAIPWPSSRVAFDPFTGTAQGGYYRPTGWQSWESEADSNWTIMIDGLGAGEMSDGVDVVATRLADASRLYDPGGTWAATAYGEATYGGGDPWAGDAGRLLAKPAVAGYLYVVLQLDGSNEVSGVDGPHFAASLPPNTSTEKTFVIAASDGLGGVKQIQEGPIIWVP